MGLDMYLEKYPRYRGVKPKDVSNIEDYLGWVDGVNSNGSAAKYSLKEWCGVDEGYLPSKECIDFYSKYFISRHSYWDVEKEYPHKRIMDQVGYWRKANAIHNWFVENVQNGVDDCKYYEVYKPQLQDLLYICEDVLNGSVMVEAKIKNGERLENGEWIPIMEDGKKIINPEFAHSLLPTTSGFFFGSTDYDEYYIQDIVDTINILKEVLANTDFDNEVIVYSASW